MAFITRGTLRRALLYVPGSSPKFISKSLSLPAVDNITYDLEDSVTTSQKPSARKFLLENLPKKRPANIGELAIRINAINTPFAHEDLLAISSIPSLDAIVIPKVSSSSDLHFVSEVLKEKRKDKNPVKLIALIESAKAIMDIQSICKASKQLDGLIFAAEDFALDLSLTRTPDLTEFLYARSAIVTASRAFGLSSTIDLVCTSYRDSSGLETLKKECINGKNLGFNGKQCIHPNQIETVQNTFAPGKEEINWAVRVVTADEKAEKEGRGAWTLDGKMIDAPVSSKARKIVELAENCGIDVGTVREKWRDQEPE